MCATLTHTHPDIIVHSHLLPLPIFGMQLIFYSVNFIKICFIPLQAGVSHAWSCTIYTYISKHPPTTLFHVFTPTQTHTGTRFGSNTRRNTAKHRPYFMGNWATTTNTCSFDNTKQRLQHQNLFHICTYVWILVNVLVSESYSSKFGGCGRKSGCSGIKTTSSQIENFIWSSTHAGKEHHSKKYLHKYNTQAENLR